MIKKTIIKDSILVLLVMFVLLKLLLSCDHVINTVNDPHFESDGTLVMDSTQKNTFKPTQPNKINFYIEVSGSMNGFFRANLPTQFKADVWQILSYYSGVAKDVTILTNDGNMGAIIPLPEFQAKMNTGAFISTASTKVPVMLKSIMSTLKPNKGEVAVLISDMKYSPAGSAAAEVLMSQYTTDVGKILGTYGKAISLIGATSDYKDKSGSILCEKSPYYFLVIGNGPEVAFIRNGISSILEMNNHLIDNIESGFEYGKPSCTFGIPDNCVQYNDEPTFTDFNTSTSDTCTIKLKINLENYRWLISNPKYFTNAIKLKALYGSNVKVGKVEFDVKNITEINGANELVRTAVAIVELKVYDMMQESDVIEWTLELPDTDITLFSPYLGAISESDVTKSYSLDAFLRGMFQASVVNKSLKSNYILVSKNSQ